MTIIYGRRVGKSTLIKEFVKGKKVIFYTATRVGAERNLELFANQVINTIDPSLSGLKFGTIENVFDFLTSRYQNNKEKMILVIDELPYWAEKDEPLLSIIQKYIDTYWIDKNMMIILCGSSLSFMENKVLSEKSPIFGRRDSQIKLETFNYKEAALFVPKYSLVDKAICYGVTGGGAKYLSMFDPKKSLDDNIVDLFFNPNGYLFDETSNLLIQEFSNVSLVNNIIELIASGENNLNNIVNKLHEKDSGVLYYLERLIELGIVEKKKCITEENNKKKTLYVLKDHMFEFWYKFIPKAVSVIEMGEGEIYYKNVVKPQIHSYMGTVFEEMCMYYTLKEGITGKYGPIITNVGKWWGTEKVKKENGDYTYQSTDIDIVGISSIDKTAIVCECKFKNEKIDKEVYERLVKRIDSFPSKYNVVKYMLFSLSGFTKWFDNREDSKLILLTINDIYK